MKRRPEPDDVDLFIGGVEPDAEDLRETARFIKEHKSRPDYPAEAEEAEKILASLGLHPPDYGVPEASASPNNRRASEADPTKPAPEKRPKPAKTQKK